MTNWRDIPKRDWPIVEIEFRGKVFRVDPKKVFPYAHVVPNDLRENLIWRRTIIKLGRENADYAQQIWNICERDPLFYWNTFAWAFDPRAEDLGVNPIGPFIAWEPFQPKALIELLAAYGMLARLYPGLRAHDLAVKKSRDMGVSWMGLLVIEHSCHFRDNLSFILGSRKKEYVDSKKALSLFWKLRHLVKHLPEFIKPNYESVDMRLTNLDRGSIMAGEATGSNIGAGGRETGALLDEFSRYGEVERGSDYEAWRVLADTTHSRVAVSTLKGTANKFYEITSPGSGTRTLEYHWTAHPEKKIGLYRVFWDQNEAKTEILDTEWHAANPDYVLRKTPGGGAEEYAGLRSPWYDAEEDRRGTGVEMAEDVDMVPWGGSSMFFPRSIINTAKRSVLNPTKQCRLQDVIENQGVNEVYPDRAKFWCGFDFAGRPPQATRYAMGCDLGRGTGASNSTMVVLDATTGQKVFEYVNNEILTLEFAELAVEVAKLFSTPISKCFLNWEATGEGLAFSKRVVFDLKYTYTYRFRNKSDRKSRKSNKPGWFHSGDNKETLFAEYRDALSTGAFMNSSAAAVDELQEYIITDRGPEHAKQNTSTDPAANKQSHGDLVIADAVCWLAIRELDPPQPPKVEVPYGSFAWRKREFEKAYNAAEEWDRPQMLADRSPMMAGHHG